MLTKQGKRKLSLLIVVLMLFTLLIPVNGAFAAWIEDLGYNGTTGITGVVYAVYTDPAVNTAVYAAGYSGIITTPQFSDLLTWSVSGGVYYTPEFLIPWSKTSSGQTVSVVVYNSGRDTVLSSVYNTTVPARTSTTPTSPGGGTTAPETPVTPVTPPAVYPTEPTAPVTQAITESAAATVTTSDGTVSVTLPAGAVEGAGTVSITEVAADAAPPAQVGSIVLQVGSKIFEITLTGAELKENVTLTFAFDTAKFTNVPADQIGVYYYNEARGSWVYAGGDVDTTTGKVNVTVNHFTKFAVMANTSLPVLSDIPAHWARADIKRLVGMLAIGGYPDKTFKPDNNITRNEFAVILAKAMDWKGNSPAAAKFKDAGSIPAWARGSVGAAVEKGVISGYEDGTFGGERLITRSEIAVMVVKALGKAASTGALTFADAAKAPDWAKGFIATAVAEGIIKGKPGNVFAPNDNATRAESSTMVVRVLNNLKI